jgi:hypothetical protein
MAAGREALSAEMSAYRDFLIAADQKASEAYDKTVMTLSGGALGLSITFLKDIIRQSTRVSIQRLEWSWMCLSLSVLLILVSMLFSQWALRKAITQVDDGTVGDGRVGGGFSILTGVLNVISGLSCVAGIVLLAWFSLANIKN